MHNTQFQFRFFRPVVRSALGLILSAGALACRDAKPVASGVDLLQLKDAPSALPLSLQADRGIQTGRVATDTIRRLRTAKRLDDDATSRLCGVLVGRSRLSEALPFAWPVDSLLPQLAPRIIVGTDVYGLRVLIPGTEASYRFEGFTIDGGTRVSLRWPVRSDRSVPATASDPEIEAVIQPSPSSLDSLVQSLRYADATPKRPWVSAPSAESAPVPARIVRLVRDARYFPIGFSAPCRDAHFSISVGAGIDKLIRVLTVKNERIGATVSSPTGKIVVSVIAGDDETTPAPSASATATSDGYVTLRVRYTAETPNDPNQQNVFLRVTSEQR